jgi:hypothetical protein
MKIPKWLIVVLVLPVIAAVYVYYAHPKLGLELYRKYVLNQEQAKNNAPKRPGKKALQAKSEEGRKNGKNVKDEEEQERDLEELLHRKELLLREVNKMAHGFDKELVEFLMSRFDQLSDRSKGAFLERLGRYSKKNVDTFLINQANDGTNANVQLRAIGALARAKSPQRESALKKLYLGRKNLNPETTVVVIGSYYRILTDTQLLGSLEKELLKYIQQAMEENNESFLYRCLMELSKIDPENRKMFELSLQYLKKRGSFDSPEFTNYLIKILSRYRPKKIEKDFLTFFGNGDVKVQVELLNSLSLICPKKIWSLLDEVLSTSQNARIHLALARNMIFFPVEDSIPYLEKNRDSFKIDDKRWEKILLRIQDSGLGNTCQTVKFKRPEK